MQVDEGTLELAKSSTAVALLNNSALIIGDGVGGKHADVVRYTGPGANQINATVQITINWSGLLNLNGFDDQVGTLIFVGGDLVTGAGTAFLMGDITVNPNTNSVSEISGRLGLQATRTISIPTLKMIPDLKILAEITGPGGLVFNGARHAWLVRIQQLRRNFNHKMAAQCGLPMRGRWEVQMAERL